MYIRYSASVDVVSRRLADGKLKNMRLLAS